MDLGFINHIDTFLNELLQDLNAVAVTVKPGLSLSLLVGLQYAKQLVKKTG